MLHFEDNDNGGDQNKDIRDIEDSFTELNISGIENDNEVLTKNTNILFKFYHPS